jgi:hypothetical protein
MFAVDGEDFTAVILAVGASDMLQVDRAHEYMTLAPLRRQFESRNEC